MAKRNSFFHYPQKIHFPSREISFIFFIVIVCIGIYFWQDIRNFSFSFFKKDVPIIHESISPTPTVLMHPYPSNITNIYPGEEVSAESVVVLDVDSHVYLYKRNEHVELFPASTTKIMTALVALDVYKLDDIITVKNATTEGQIIGLTKGEQITVENLLYGALIHSGNDAAAALADGYPGGTDKFIEKMNEKAKMLHMEESRFVNATGFDDENHKMTAIDLSLLAVAAISNSTIRKMVAIPQITISDVTHTYFHKLVNVNQLLGKIPGVGGIKTGWTEAAGENLVTFVERDNKKLIFVVLHSRDRFGDSMKLIDWAFKNYRWEDLTKDEPR